MSQNNQPVDDTSKFLTAHTELSARGEWDEIIHLCNEELTHTLSDQDRSPVYSFRGHAYFQKGEYKQAIADVTQAINRTSDDDSDKVTYYGGRGLAYFKKGEYDEAIADFTQAIDRTSDDDTKKATHYSNRGLA